MTAHVVSDNSMNETQFDCCVIGGGMVGAALAIGLAQQSYTVALVEKHALMPFDQSQGPDVRLSALNMHSVNLLSGLGAWQHLEKMRSRPYQALSVWDGTNKAIKGSGDKGITRFMASEVGHDVLGYFVENRLLQLALYAEINALWRTKITCINEQDITAIDTTNASVTLSNAQVIKASVIWGCDGARSQVRQAAGIGVSGWQYQQQANAIVIKTAVKVADETWQAFYPTGPRALLPMHDNYACLIWYDGADQSNWIKQADVQTLKSAIKKAFPPLFSDFEIVDTAGFGLTRMHAHRYGEQKAIIVGDAAHTINPLAGQGVNLGFKDVDAVLQIVQREGLSNPQQIIAQYEKKRRFANLAMMSTMDLLYQGFSTSSKPLQMFRGIGLALANKAGPVKKMALKYAMGLGR